MFELRRLISLVVFGFMSFSVSASPTEPVEGVEYTRMQQIQTGLNPHVAYRGKYALGPY